MDILFLRLPSRAEAPYELYLRSEQGNISRLADCYDQEALHKVAQAHAEARVLAMVPDTEVLFTSVLVSAKQLKQVGAAVAYLIEEQVGEDIENLHVVQAPQQADGYVPLLLVSEARMQAWVQPIKAAGLRLDAMLPNLLFLPYEKTLGLELPPPQHWTLSLHGDQASLRTGAFAGAALEAAALPTLLQAARAESGSAQSPLHIHVLGGEAALPALESWLRQQPVAVTLRQENLEPLQYLQTLEPQSLLRHPFNLLQGSHAGRSTPSWSPAWKWAAVFLGLAFGLQLASEWVQFAYYQHKASRTQATAMAEYKQLFPQDRGVSAGNLRRRMEANLQSGQGQASGLLPLLTQMGEGMQGLSVQTQSIDFDADLKKLTVDISAQSLGQLEQIKQQLEGRGLQIEILSANAQGTGVRGRLKIVSGEV